ncbi:hypothetical protein AB835_00525 [Candidatus Endobugula sertula]|uniref:Type VI secretion system-associated lipoprotein n=1 Tax=Candidatus Endobugula sertula TaxID=62101 RepID=A0A1D2QTV6_9GAMM|nr:hypothetical protein AB835_00525 [Candidatus Endobugula sertula]
MVSCSSATSVLRATGLTSNSKNSLKSIALESLANSNFDTPVAVDIVFIHNGNITPILSALSGPEWFNKKQELMKRYDNQIDLISLEVVPLSLVESMVLPKKHKQAMNIIMFTNYQSSNGQYMAEIGHFKQLKIRLLRDSYQLVEQGG